MNDSMQQGWWESLRHFGMLLSPTEVAKLEAAQQLDRLFGFRVDQLRREMTRLDPAFPRWICSIGRTVVRFAA